MPKKQITNEKRHEIANLLMEHQSNNRLKAGAIAYVMEKYGVSKGCIRLIWNRAKESLGEKGVIDVSTHLNRSGRKKKWSLDDLQPMNEFKWHERRSLRKLTEKLGIPHSSLWRLLQTGDLLKKDPSMERPILTEPNRVSRFGWCFSHIQPNGKFEDMLNMVHVNEEWFDIYSDSTTVYVPRGQDCTAILESKSKRVIGKVRFFSAVARPRYDCHKKQDWDGKIGCWPFVEKVPTKWSKKNKEKSKEKINENKEKVKEKNKEKKEESNKTNDSLVTVPAEITAKFMKQMFLEKLIPSIRDRWPIGDKGQPIYIQQDGASPHIGEEDKDIAEALKKDGWDLYIVNQPGNSPDMNALHHGFHTSLQSAQYKRFPRSTDELVESVVDAFGDLEKEKIDDMYLTLQMVMDEVLLNRGGNTYKYPQLCKSKKRKSTDSPLCIKSEYWEDLQQEAEDDERGNDEAEEEKENAVDDEKHDDDFLANENHQDEKPHNVPTRNREKGYSPVERRLKRKKDPNKPKRWKSSYVFFKTEVQPKVMAENPDLRFLQMGKVLGEMWRALTPDERKKYDDISYQDKMRFNREMEAYKQGHVPPLESTTSLDKKMKLIPSSRIVKV